MTKVMIGIQARSGSTRLPRKAFELIAGKMLLDHVIDSCKAGAYILQKKSNIESDVVVLTPYGDPIVTEFKNRVKIFEGDSLDVMERYHKAIHHYKPDYIVRITGDCPLLPAFLIANFVTMAIRKGYDYVSNVDERFRTAIDGHDCEVISKRLFDEMVIRAHNVYDREHVTPWIRSCAPEWARIGVALNNHDLSHIKLSVDTQEDLERVRQAFDGANAKMEAAKSVYKYGVHRI